MASEPAKPPGGESGRGGSAYRPSVDVVSPLLDEEDGGASSSSPTGSGRSGLALVALNAPIPSGSALFDRLWEKSAYRVCADGGANRLYRSRPSYTPDLVVGDLDSLHPKVRDRFQARGAEIRQVIDQDRNDLDKALEAVAAKAAAAAAPVGTDDRGPQLTAAVVYGAFGGRFDQEAASFQALFRWAGGDVGGTTGGTGIPLWLYDDRTCACLICPGGGVEHRIRLAPEWEGPTCGLIPLGGRCDSVTTAGLVWNLDRHQVEFGGLVSTSNRVADGRTASVWTSHPLLWTAEVRGRRPSAAPDEWDEGLEDLRTGGEEEEIP